MVGLDERLSGKIFAENVQYESQGEKREIISINKEVTLFIQM